MIEDQWGRGSTEVNSKNRLTNEDEERKDEAVIEDGLSTNGVGGELVERLGRLLPDSHVRFIGIE